MYRIPELLRGRSIGIVRTEIRVLRFVSICAPMPFVLTGIGVKDDHTMIAIPIGDVNLVGLLVDKDFGRPSEILFAGYSYD